MPTQPKKVGLLAYKSLCGPIQIGNVSADGQWAWGSWSQCSAICGTGTRNRTATSCNGPFYGGLPCRGSGTETENCTGEHFHTNPRKMNNWFHSLSPSFWFSDFGGTWSAWDAWGACSASCGGGSKNRTRNFSGGQPCNGNSTDSQICTGETFYQSMIIYLSYDSIDAC